MNAFQLFRSLVIYGICLPLAIFIGYMLATPTDLATFVAIGLLFCLMVIPLFLRWHYPWLIFCWNSVAGFYFLPGHPSWILIMAFASFGFSFLSYVLNRNLKFISVPSMTRPLVALTAVVLVTAKFNGGIGFGELGAESMGGKRYLILLSAVFGYFALTARKIPREKADLYIKLFFWGAFTAVVGSLFAFITPSLYPIFLIFPAEMTDQSVQDLGSPVGIARFGGLAIASMTMISFLLARHGVTGIFNLRKYWRFFIFLLLMIGTLYGGYRGRVIELLLILSVMFWLEGMYRSRVLPVLVLCLIMAVTLLVPFSDKLPLTIQRSLTFLPLKLDPNAESNAKASTDWRLEMWASVIPQLPKCLIIGKGYSMDAHESEVYQMASGGSDSSAGSAMAGDYHNGPLSVIMPFGIPGVITFLWVLGAGFRILWRNYHFGDPEYQLINRYLLGFYIVKIILFFFVFGSLYSELLVFLGPVGFSIALNGGVKSAALEPIRRPVFNKFKLANALR